MSTLVSQLKKTLDPYKMVVETGPSPRWRANVEGLLLAVEIDLGAALAKIEVRIQRDDLVIVADALAVSRDDALRTGDTAFDAACAVFDRGPNALGLLDHDTRALATVLVARGVFVAGGAVRWHLPLHGVVADLDGVLARMLRLAARLRLDERALADEVERIARTDAAASVRPIFAALLAQKSESESAARLDAIDAFSAEDQATLERLVLEVRDAGATRSVRLAAALKLLALFPLARLDVLASADTDLAEPVSVRIAERMREAPDDEDAQRAGARLLLAIGRSIELALSPPAFVSVLEALATARATSALAVFARACDHGDPRVLETAIRGLCRLGVSPHDITRKLSAPALERIEAVLPRLLRQDKSLGGADLALAFFKRVDPRDIERRIAYLDVLVATGDRRLASHLAGHLDSPYEVFQLALLRALATLGTLDVVPLVKPLTTGFFRSSALKDAAAAAITAIRTREGARSLPGALTISDAAGIGALSDPDAS